jgi:ribose 5-phosphate isomerase
MMGALPILQRGRHQPVCLSNDDLPVFYMSDYSVLGLKVDSLDRAQRVLSGNKFMVVDKSDHLEITIDGADQMPAIVDLLNQNGLNCALSDIVDQVYQG